MNVSALKLKTVHGWAFPAADEFMSKELRADGTYQLPHLQAALAYVTDFSCAIDAGAHIGTWTKPLSSLFARVIAVEPSPDTFAALELNVARFCVGSVQTKACALGAAAGRVSLELDGKNQARKNTGARYVLPGGTIPCETIDSWGLPSLGFLKLDVEGSEPDVLDGALRTLARCRPIVLFENKAFWTRYGKPADAPHAILSSLGYRHLQTISHDEIWGAR